MEATELRDGDIPVRIKGSDNHLVLELLAGATICYVWRNDGKIGLIGIGFVQDGSINLNRFECGIKLTGQIKLSDLETIKEKTPEGEGSGAIV